MFYFGRFDMRDNQMCEILKTAGRTANTQHHLGHRKQCLVYTGNFRPLNVQGQSEDTQCIRNFWQSCISKTARHRAKRSEM